MLTNGRAEVAVAPADGARVSRYRVFSSARTCSFLAEDHPAFPMLPFGSRVEFGSFSFDECRVQLPPNNPPETHAIHGEAFQRSWHVVHRAKSAVILAYEGGGEAWPWRYRAECTVALRGQALVLTLRLCNLSESVMPFGLGWHPYFALTENTRLDADVSGRWVLDDELIGRRFEPLLEQRTTLHNLRPALLDLDAAYGGWSGSALLHWPEWRARLRMTTTGADSLVVYSPLNEGFVCLEPLSNAPNGFNLESRGTAASPFRVLAPGEAALQRLQLDPEVGS